jgi:transcriptional accessory protein Tex/SPT6
LLLKLKQWMCLLKTFVIYLSAPAGGRTTLGVDPGIRTGVKLAVMMMRCTCT